jgi:hypothetical protein
MDNTALDKLREAYREAVEVWITAIQEEVALTTPDHSVKDVDQWEAVGFREEQARIRAKAAKIAYEELLRRVNFGL